jgi:hypothetical protein
MLCCIGEESAEEARRILTFLCFSARPLSVAEVIDAIAVDVDMDCFDPELKVANADDLLRICPGLIEIYEATPETADDLSDLEYVSVTEDLPEFVRIAHFSVQEFLLSDRISRGPAAEYTLSHAAGHLQISTACLIYLCNEDFLRSNFTWELLREYPFAHFAARHWYEHWDLGKADMLAAFGAWSLKLFTRPDCFTRWLRLAPPDRYWDRVKYDDEEVIFTSPLYYAAFLGLEQILLYLLSHLRTDINGEGGEYGNALHAASSRGHHRVLQILLDAGADVNGEGLNGTALQAASLHGHERVVQILLDAGADINAQGGLYGTALQEASLQGHERVVQILLDAGADVNAQGGIGTALQAASGQGHQKVVQILLDAGADVNVWGGMDGTALQAASGQGHQKVVQILLDAGADVNALGGIHGTASHAASRGSRWDESDDELAAGIPRVNLEIR